MELQFLILIFGVGLLWSGAELLVRNSSTLARSIGLSPTIIGLTIVSIGTSLPEFVVSFMAALQNSMGISIGNIIGSNIANIGLILGIGAMITPLEVKRSWVTKEVPAMIFFTLLFTGFAYSNYRIGRIEGIVLFCLLLLFLAYLSRTSRTQIIEFQADQAAKDQKKTLSRKKVLTYSGLSLLGIVLLIEGSRATVGAGENIARSFGISEEVIGLSLIAIGTSLPELATTIVGVLRKETELVVGNVVGSNIFNLLFIGGVIPIIHPIPISKVLFAREFPFLILFSILVWPIMRIRWNVHRYEGIILFGLYILFLTMIFLHN